MFAPAISPLTSFPVFIYVVSLPFDSWLLGEDSHTCMGVSVHLCVYGCIYINFNFPSNTHSEILKLHVTQRKKMTNQGMSSHKSRTTQFCVPIFRAELGIEFQQTNLAHSNNCDL